MFEWTVSFAITLVQAYALWYLFHHLTEQKNAVKKHGLLLEAGLVTLYIFLFEMRRLLPLAAGQIPWELLSVFLLLLLFCENKYSISYVILLFFSLTELTTFVSFGIETLIYKCMLDYYSDSVIGGNVLDGVSYVIYFIVFFFLMRCVIKIAADRLTENRKTLSLKEFWFLATPCISGIILSVILRVFLFLDSNTIYEKYPIILALFLLAGIVLLLTILITADLHYNMKKLFMEQKNAVILQRQIKGLQEQIRSLETTYSNMRELRHDLKNHISNLKSLELRNDTKGEAEKYATAMEKSLSWCNTECNTGNTSVDVILDLKCKEMAQKKIPYHVDAFFSADIKIDVYDLSIILCNTIDNAIEACAGEPRSFIQVKTFYKGNLLFIEIENSFSGEIEFDKGSGLPVSSKKERELHGIGLKNIQKIARKYKGDIEIERIENKFILTVMMVK